MDKDQARQHNRQARVIHNSDEIWSQASDHLDHIIASVLENEEAVYDIAGNTDPSVFFVYMCQHIDHVENPHPVLDMLLPEDSETLTRLRQLAHESTKIICAAAITRLVWASRTNPDILTRLDFETPTVGDDSK